jgi:polyketide cyclase/dehydrase/lipid transport protein
MEVSRMARIKSTVIIARAREQVFGYFLALEENIPRSNPDVEWVSKSPEGPTRVGTTLRSRGKTLGRVRETTMRFTGIAPPETIEFEAEVGPMRPKGVFTFDEVEAGTRVTFRGDPNPVGPFKLLTPLFNHVGRHVWDERLARAKSMLEGA